MRWVDAWIGCQADKQKDTKAEGRRKSQEGRSIEGKKDELIENECWDGTDGWMNGRTDGWMDGRMDGWTDGQKETCTEAISWKT